MVSNNWVREIVMPYYHVDDDLSKARGVDSDFDWLVMNYFYESINDDKDWVIIVSLPIGRNC